MSADASDDIGHKKMAFLASALCQEITSTIFDLLPSMPRTDDDGNPKYTGFMLMQHEPEGGYKDWQYGQLLDPSATSERYPFLKTAFLRYYQLIKYQYGKAGI